MRGLRRAHVATASPCAAALVATTLLAAAACSRAIGGTRPGPASIPLVVENHGYYDVVVYAVPSGTGPGMRVGTAAGFATTRLTVRPNHLQPGDGLVVRLRAFGTQQSWVSPGVMLGPGVVPRLAVYTNGDGGMSRSVLYTGLGGAHVGR